MIGVDEIDPDGGMADADLTGRGRRQLDVVQYENFRAAGFGKTDGFHAKIPNCLFLLNKYAKVVFEMSGGGPPPLAGEPPMRHPKDGPAGAPFNAA